MRVFRPRALAAGFFALSLISATPALALSVTYTFTGSTGHQTSEPVDSQPIDATLSDITRGAGVIANAGANSINSRGWTTAATIDLADYYQFTITPDAGVTMDLTALTFTERRSATGVGAFQVRTSLDSFASPIFTFDVPDNDANRRHTIALGAAFEDLFNPVTFRIFGYEAEGSLGTWRLGIDVGSTGASLHPSNLELLGYVGVAQVPQPASVILMGTGLLGIVTIAWRRRLRVARKRSS